MSLRFSINAWAAWSPHCISEQDWRAWADGRRPDKSAKHPDKKSTPAVTDIPMMMRRRLPRLGRMALRVALDAGANASDHLVFASQHGNSHATSELLHCLAHKQALSPTEFSMSVHNAYAGILSILKDNKQSHTAISGGRESFCVGLLEAAMIMRESPNRDALLICYDENFAPALSLGEPTGIDLAVALKLTPNADRPATADGNTFTYGLDSGSDADHAPVSSKEEPGLSFLRFYLGGGSKWRWTGNRNTWWCRRECD